MTYIYMNADFSIGGCVPSMENFAPNSSNYMSFPRREDSLR